MPSRSLRTKLTLAFATLCAVILISLGVTLYESTKVKTAVNQNVEETIPVAFAGAQLASNINGTMASLRGWVLTSNPLFKENRASLWADIETQSDLMDTHLGADDDQWNQVKTQITALKALQDQVETIAHSKGDEPASEILNTQVTPLTDSMLSHISQVYIEEISLAATPQRKQMLGQMGDIRGGIAVVIGNVRAYLLTGEQHYAGQYQAVWNWVKGQLDQLNANQNALSATQQTQMAALTKAANEVTPLFSQMVDIRAGDEWNKSRALLIKEVMPLTTTLLEALNNPETGLLATKRQDMEQSGTNTVEAVSELTLTTYILAASAILISIAAVYLSNRTVVTPVRRMTTIMSRLAQGNLNVTIPDQDRQDEIGEMAQAIQVFKVNGEERNALAQEQAAEQERRAARARSKTSA